MTSFSSLNMNSAIKETLLGADLLTEHENGRF